MFEAIYTTSHIFQAQNLRATESGMLILSFRSGHHKMKNTIKKDFVSKIYSYAIFRIIITCH
jgi:hypothetical protein